jgi:hypothetical protein
MRKLARAVARGRSIASWARKYNVSVESAERLSALPEFRDSIEKIRLETRMNEAGDREDDLVAHRLKRLFWNARGALATAGISNVAHGGPPASGSGNIDDPNDPRDLVKLLEATAKGCQALLAEWRELLGLIESREGWMAPHRLKAIRMLGLQPVAVALDQRIVQI